MKHRKIGTSDKDKKAKSKTNPLSGPQTSSKRNASVGSPQLLLSRKGFGKNANPSAMSPASAGSLDKKKVKIGNTNKDSVQTARPHATKISSGHDKKSNPSAVSTASPGSLSIKNLIMGNTSKASVQTAASHPTKFPQGHDKKDDKHPEKTRHKPSQSISPKIVDPSSQDKLTPEELANQFFENGEELFKKCSLSVDNAWFAGEVVMTPSNVLLNLLPDLNEALLLFTKASELGHSRANQFVKEIVSSIEKINEKLADHYFQKGINLYNKISYEDSEESQFRVSQELTNAITEFENAKKYGHPEAEKQIDLMKQIKHVLSLYSQTKLLEIQLTEPQSPNSWNDLHTRHYNLNHELANEVEKLPQDIINLIRKSATYQNLSRLKKS